MTGPKLETISDDAGASNTSVPKLEVVDAPTAPLPDIHVVVGRQQNQYFDSPEWPTLEEQTLPIAWILRHDGMWQRRINDVGVFLAHVSKFAVPGFPKEEAVEGFVLKRGLIPHELLDDCISFFKEICDMSKDEVYLQIFWGLNPDNPERTEDHFFVWCPTQEVSGASVNFIRNVELEEKATLIYEIHSHNTMGAFFSETDNKDEKSDRLFAVVGKLDEAKYQIKHSYVCGGKRIEVPEGQIFTKPLGKNFAGWLKNVTRRGAMATTSQTWPNSSPAWRSSGSQAQGTWQTETPATSATPGIRPSHTGATSGPLIASRGRHLYEDESAWGEHDRGSSAVQKRASTTEEARTQVNAAAMAAEAAMITLKSRDFLKDAEVVSGFKTETQTSTASSAVGGEPEVSSTKPFFPQASTEAKANGNELAQDDDKFADWVNEQQAEAWDKALEQKVLEIQNHLANQKFVEVEMTDDKKKAMFSELMVHMEPHDIALLTETIADMGYSDAMAEAIADIDFDDSDSSPITE